MSATHPGAERSTRPRKKSGASRRRSTFADFCALIKDGQKADLIDGVIYMASPDNLDANELFMWLGFLLNGLAAKTNQGKVYGSRAAFRLAEHESPEPDLAFVRADRLHLAQRGFFQGAPDLAMEIVSPESVDRDYDAKRLQYEQAGVAEYWIIDELEQEVTLLRLNKSGKYRRVKPLQGELRSHVLRGFRLRPEWLWRKPLPVNVDVLQDMLSGPTRGS